MGSYLHTVLAITGIAGPSPYIYSIDLNNGKLLWKGGKGGTSLYSYENRLYLIKFGQLYAYEHVTDEKNEETKYIYFAMLVGPLILTNLFIKTKKYSGRLYRSFEFCSLLIIIVFILILTSETLSNQYINYLMIIFSPADWMLYLLFPAISVIAGTIAGMKFENRFMISAVAGVVPYILAIAVSFLFLSITEIFVFLSSVHVIISIRGIIIIGLFYGIIGSMIDFILSRMKGGI